MSFRIAVLTAWSVATCVVAGKTPSEGVYTVAQAIRGEQVYGQACAACRLPTLKGERDAPGLVGDAFVQKWDAFTLGEMYELIKATMPKDRPDSLTPPMVADVMAYILAQNGYSAGDTELPPQIDSLGDLRLGQGSHETESMFFPRTQTDHGRSKSPENGPSVERGRATRVRHGLTLRKAPEGRIRYSAKV